MSQDLLYSVLPRPTNNQVSKVKGGVKKIDKIPKKGMVNEEHTSLDDENIELKVDNKPSKHHSDSDDGGSGLDTYA